MPETQTSGVDLKQVVSILRRQAGIILACCGLAAGAAIGLSTQQQKKYTAQAALLFTEPDAGQNLLSLGASPQSNPTRMAQTNLELVSLPIIASDTAKALGDVIAPGAVQKAIKLEPRGESDVVEIQATHESPTLAANIANVFAQQYIEFRRKSAHDAIAQTRRTVERQIEVLRRRPGVIARSSSAGRSSGQLTPLQTQLETLQSRVADLGILESVQTGNARIVQQATPPSTPSSPKIRRNVLIALFGGLLLGLLLALLREQFNRRITSPQEYATVLNAPLVGTIPVGDALGRPARMPHQLSTHEEESFRMLHSALRLSLAGDDAKVVIVTSAVPSEGKSTVALHLAAAACSLGERVLLIDADFQRPGLHKLMKLSPGPGLPEVLIGAVASLDDAIQPIPVVYEEYGDAGLHMDVLISGNAPDHPGRLLGSARVAEVVRDVRPTYDRIIIDTAPATVVSDPIALMQRLPAIILVVARMEKVTIDAAERLHRQLATAGAEVEGVVANFVRGDSSGGYYYSYGERSKNGRSAPDMSPPVSAQR